MSNLAIGIMNENRQLEIRGFVDPLAMARHWKWKNPIAYGQLVTWAREDIDNGTAPSIGLYAELLRRPHFANKLRLVRSDKQFLINNNLRADLARLIEEDHHEIHFRKRRAKADDWSTPR